MSFLPLGIDLHPKSYLTPFSKEEDVGNFPSAFLILGTLAISLAASEL